MKAALLSAGKGERLRPLTDQTAKCLLPVGGQVILDHWLHQLWSGGVKDVLINLHYCGDKIINHMSNANMDGMRIAFCKEQELLGTAGTLFRNREYFKGEYLFIVAYSDTWTNLSIKTMINYHRKRPGIMTVGLFEAPNLSDCGVVKVDKGTIVAFEEKPENPKGKWAFAGILIAHPSALKNLDPSMKDIAKDWLPTLVGKMNAFMIRDPVIDIGTSIDAYKKADDIVCKMGLRAL